MNTDFIKGVVVPIITVIDKEEKIDEEGMRRQVDFVINGGMHGILAFGSNGEFYQIEEDEMERGLKIMVDQAAGRVPVYFGIGAINTRKCVRLAKMAVANGASCVSILQPMFLKPTAEELYTHFKTIADAIPDTPVLIYNNPGRVGYGISADMIDRLAHTVPNIVGMKDTSGDITLTAQRRCYTGIFSSGNADHSLASLPVLFKIFPNPLHDFVFGFDRILEHDSLCLLFYFIHLFSVYTKSSNCLYNSINGKI